MWTGVSEYTYICGPDGGSEALDVGRWGGKMGVGSWVGFDLIYLRNFFFFFRAGVAFPLPFLFFCALPFLLHCIFPRFSIGCRDMFVMVWYN